MKILSPNRILKFVYQCCLKLPASAMYREWYAILELGTSLANTPLADNSATNSRILSAGPEIVLDSGPL